MSMSPAEREYLDDALMKLNNAIAEFRDKIINLEARCSTLHQEILVVKNKSGLK